MESCASHLMRTTTAPLRAPNPKLCIQRRRRRCSPWQTASEDHMSWNYDRSIERIRTHVDNIGEITIEKLKREADLEQLLSETNCREIYGAHVYIDVTNFSSLASAATANKEDVKRLA